MIPRDLSSFINWCFNNGITINKLVDIDNLWVMYIDSINTVTHKECNRCKVIYPATLEYFYALKTVKSGLRGLCKYCQDSAQKSRRISSGGNQPVINLTKSYVASTLGVRVSELDDGIYEAKKATIKLNRLIKRKQTI